MTNAWALLLVAGAALAGAGFALVFDSLFGTVELEDAAPLLSGILMGLGIGVAVVAGMSRRREFRDEVYRRGESLEA
jgi:hypothetical protein